MQVLIPGIAIIGLGRSGDNRCNRTNVRLYSDRQFTQWCSKSNLPAQLVNSAVVKRIVLGQSRSFTGQSPDHHARACFGWDNSHLYEGGWLWMRQAVSPQSWLNEFQSHYYWPSTKSLKGCTPVGDEGDAAL